MALELRLLGPLQALRDGEEVPLPGVKLRAVLATLALRAGEAVSVDRLADVLWADAPPQTLMTQIQAQISTLRRLLDPLHAPGAAGELIETRPPGYRLNADAARIDLDRFEAALRDGREAREAGATSVAVEHFRRGLGVWRGEALADLPREAFGPEAARLEDLRLAALELRIEAELALDRHEAALEELAALCLAHPYRETLWEKRMIALYRSGRQAEALAAYRTARSTFIEALGIEPGERLRDLERAILRHDPALEGRAVAGALATSRPVLVAGVLDDVAPLTALALLAMAEADVIAVGHVAVDADLAQAARAVRAEITAVGAGATVRCAAFRSRDVAHDLARLAQEQDAGLVVVSLARGGDLPLQLLAACAADVALVRAQAVEALETIAVPFTGSTHDWAAVALAGRVAASRGLPLELIGVDAGAAGDASRALANAALALARVAGVEAAPRLVPAGALAAAPLEAALVVTGLPESYRRTGLGRARAALLDRKGCAVVFAHCGPRPGALAPVSSLTRFTWSLAD